ncbi:MAG: imidazole glycerol phosphate synthase subunit HisH [Bryobacteraceae bacterium]
MIAIVDYGAGNLRSVQNTLEEIGASYKIFATPEDLDRAEKIILPGVGHFGQMMRSLDRLGFRDPILDRIRAGVPFLGICLGLQALFQSSEEAPGERGLGIFEGTVRRFDAGARVPHMGWNELERRGKSRLLAGLDAKPYVYFAHSYYVPEIPAMSAACTYTVPYTAILEHENICSVQFHPEKSGPIGVKIVRNFIE